MALLQAREFLSETGVGEEHEYTFLHALTQEVAYASLPEEQRRALHGRILQAMERLYAGQLDDKLGELVHHALEGRRWEEAVRFLERAGTRALAQFANTEAAACFERALVALSHLPERRDRQELAIDLRFGLRNALTPLGQVHRTIEYLREAEKLAGALGDDRRRARALSFAANCLCIVADYESAIEASQQARQHAKSLEDSPLTVASGMYLGRAHAGLGNYRGARLRAGRGGGKRADARDRSRVQRVTLDLRLGRREAEALALELRQLAVSAGLTVKELAVVGSTRRRAPNR